MQLSSVETFFNVFNETVEIIQKELDCSYLEAIAESGQNLFEENVTLVDIHPSIQTQLLEKYKQIALEDFDKEVIRKAYQLTILKGMQKNIQPNHQMTPDSIGIFMSYLINKFTENKEQLSLLDPALGTGNLLTTILNQLKDKDARAYGVEIDDLLIKLAYVGANLQEQPIQLFNQDTLQPLFVDPVDIVVADLPIGYYPDDVNAASYKLKAEKGHAYAHHLFIEQSLKHTLPGGYNFFLVPNALFESEQAAQLHQFFAEEAYIQGFIQLPVSLFSNKQNAKSILIVQKKSEDVVAPKQVLLASLPSLTKAESLEKIMAQINQWFSDNK